jgi:DNA-binding Xre family transcriptional regulator
MTRFGEYLAKRSVSKAALSKRTGITVQRLNDLTLKDNARPMGFELYLVAKAIEADLDDMHAFLYGHLKLKEITEEKN